MPYSLLQLLKSHRSQWLTTEALHISLNLSPSTITNQISQLRQRGYSIELSPIYGYRLLDQPTALTADLLEYNLQTQRLGSKIIVYQSTDSTNDIAWHYAHEPNHDGLVVFAENQRLGRGRQGRQWSSPPATGILCSILLMDNHLIGQSLTLLASLSVAQAIEDLFSIQPRIKWPNDVMFNNKKLAGIMVESRKINNQTAYVIGIGINCLQTAEDFPPDIIDTAVSIQQLTDTPIDRVHLAQHLLRVMDQWLINIHNGQSQSLHDNWQTRCDDIGRRITLISNSQSFTGRVIDVSIAQGLILQLDAGPIKIFDPATTSVKK